ncbi:PREDICTED: uncharacterized protein LOC104822404 [Tarenaya hassleriana]|uniref:uncharacterized protein LOC104822404 n=1 Tax=Tarenaya hassleriana TaxID=28532 RepID=UPI00053C4077|nr:PREDICTED: uncharacterized protein LOC104822404 [Tarenaya hassleriana]
MAATRSLMVRVAFVCAVVALLAMAAECHEGHHHGPAMAPSPTGKTMAPSPSPKPSAASFLSSPHLVATAFLGALSFLF